ncbi:MAG: SAM hydrolase/SAM-dependent halogenase family protein [Acidobacteriota bacterium]
MFQHVAFLILIFPLFVFAAPSTIVFMSDFGTIDDSVAICKGVMLGIEPDVRIVDITHQVTPFSILDGARFLAGTSPHFGSGTVFVVVVDPGVGSIRKAIVAKSRKGQYFVLPDNGLITLVEDRDGLEGVREITNTEWMIGKALSSTFHGRDIFAPVAAHLASGKDWREAGPKLSTHVRLNLSPSRIGETEISGEIVGLDGPYGNLVTNIPAEMFQQFHYQVGDVIHARIAEREYDFPFVKTFSNVPVGKALFYIDSRSRLGLAINQGNFADAYKIHPPAPIVIYRKKQ